MTIFDKLKYSSTEIRSAEELMKLPLVLIETYWEICYVGGANTTLERKCRMLSNDAIPEYQYPTQLLKFNEALEKYSNDNI